MSASSSRATTIDAVLSYHQSDLCGVTRFGRKLAKELGVEHDTISNRFNYKRPLFNVKPSELMYEDRCFTIGFNHKPHSIFLHGIDTDFKSRLSGASTVYCANQQIANEVGGIAAWCPGTLSDTRPINIVSNVTPPQYVTVFCMGMSHKFLPQRHLQLKRILDSNPTGYQVLFSTAFHEGSDFVEEERIIRAHISDIYGDWGIFLGFLSDVAVSNHITHCDLFAAFFPTGVRENNTSVMAAMERGREVITNLDKHSPFIHREHVYDIDRTTHINTRGWGIARKAQKFVRERFSWPALARLITDRERDAV